MKQLKTYQISKDQIIIIKKDHLYYISGVDDQFITGVSERLGIIIDQFKIKEQKFEYLGILYSDYSDELVEHASNQELPEFDPPPLRPSQIDLIKIDYQRVENYTKLKIEQLLTHENSLLRTAIRKFIDGSL